jgi:hypothetical protein
MKKKRKGTPPAERWLQRWVFSGIWTLMGWLFFYQGNLAGSGDTV